MVGERLVVTEVVNSTMLLGVTRQGAAGNVSVAVEPFAGGRQAAAAFEMASLEFYAALPALDVLQHHATPLAAHPASCSALGRCTITVTGSAFALDSSCVVGGMPCRTTVVSESQLLCMLPELAPGHAILTLQSGPGASQIGRAHV